MPCWGIVFSTFLRCMSFHTAWSNSGKFVAAPRMSDMCHVWTAPSWQGLSSRCSIGRCSHVFGLLVRHTWPLAIMPSADQVPVISTHSTMRWHKWVVLIAGSAGSALRAVRPFQPSHHAGCPTRSRLRRKCDGLLVALASNHHGADHSRNLVGKRDGGDLRRPPSQQCREPGPTLGAMDLGIADDGERTGHEQAAQIAVTLFADTAEPVLAPA